MKKIAFLGLILAVFLLASCSPRQEPSAGIQITDTTVAVGGAEGSGDQQIVTYGLTLQNTTHNEVVVRWVEPVLNDAVSGRLIADSPRISVDKVLEPQSSLVVNGQFRFDASGVTKSEIDGWQPFFEEVHISTELNLFLPAQADKQP